MESIAEKVFTEFSIRVSRTGIDNYLKSIHYSFKRISFVPVARNSTTTLDIRYNYAVKFSELVASQRKLFFIDETGVQVHARTNYGRSLKGTRANKRVKAVRGRNYSICAAMDSESLYFYEAQAVGYNAVDFAGYLSKFFDYLA